MSQEDVRIEDRWQKTLLGEQSFLRKEGEVLILATHTNMHPLATHTNMRLLTTHTNMDLLAEATTIYVDGTFEICPRLFYQVFTINAFIHGQQLPLVYGLLPGKSRDIYHQFFMGVKEEAMNNGQHISPEEIMTDFELTLVQSLELEFPGAHIHGCYFHFAQCLWRKVQRLGLVEEYKEDEFIRCFIQKSAAIAFVPPNFVRVSCGMDLKLRCQIIVRCRVTPIISTKPG